MLEFVSKDARTVVYKTDDPRELSDKKLASLDWVKTVPRLKVLLPGKLRGVHEILRRSISAKYTVRVVYSMQTKDLQVPKVVCPKRAVKLVEYADPQAAKSLFINTQSRFFLAPWSERIDHAYLTSLAEFLKNLLPQTKSARIEINGQSVGLVTVYKQDEGTDQIAWIWLQSSLSDQERSTAHYRIIRWLRASKAKKIVSVVHPFNIRSSRFFEALGFYPTHIWIARFV